MRRLFVLVPALRTHRGHFHNRAKGFFLAGRSRGLEPRVCVSNRAEPSIVEGLRAKPVFTHGPYRLMNKARVSDQVGLLRRLADRSASECEGALGLDVGPRDLVFVDSSTPALILGLGAYVSQLAPERRPRVHMSLALRGLPGSHERHYRLVARALRRWLRDERVTLDVPCEAHARAAEPVMGVPLQTFPLPKWYGDLDASPDARRERPGRALRIAVLGSPKRTKGCDLLPEVVARVLARNAGCTFLVQADTTETSVPLLAAIEGLERCETVVGPLSAECYAMELGRTDIVLLAHDPKEYRLRTSGIFAEALATGRVVVAPAGSWMGQCLDRGHGAGVQFPRYEPDAIADAVLSALERHDELRPDARRGIDVWRREHSVEAYLDRMLTEAP